MTSTAIHSETTYDHLQTGIDYKEFEFDFQLGFFEKPKLDFNSEILQSGFDSRAPKYLSWNLHLFILVLCFWLDMEPNASSRVTVAVLSLHFTFQNFSFYDVVTVSTSVGTTSVSCSELLSSEIPRLQL